MHKQPAQPRGDGRRRSLLAGLPLALIVLAFASFTSCRLARPRGYEVRLDDAAGRGAKIDDVVVWPVSAPPELLDPAAAEALTGYFRQYLIQKQYSVLSGDYVRGSASGGPAEAAARTAIGKLDADAALVVTIRDWDERGFDTVGSLAVAIDFKLVGKTGDLWSGTMKGLEDVIRSSDSPRNLAERRDLALRRIAARLVARLPGHVLRR